MTTDMQALGERLHLLLSGDAILAKTDFARSTIEQAIAALASRPDAQADEPVAYEFQHDETGRTTFVDPWQVEQGFASNNPRWQLIGPVFRYARAAAPQAPNAQHEKSNLYKEGYAAGKKAAQESFAKLISCDPNDEALGLICEALALKPEGDITEAILGTIEELKTKVGIEAEAAQGVPENIEEGLEILDNFIANVREYGNYSAEATLTFIAQARQCFAAAPSPDREQMGEAETEQSIAADSYFWIAERIGTLNGYSVQDHVDIGWKVLQGCADYFHDFVGSDEGGDDVAVRIAADLRAVLSGRLEQVEAKGVCQRCGGTGVVDDGEIVGVGGVEFENGAVKCVKDCPDCAASATTLVETNTDNIAVDTFAQAMKEKMADAHAKGRSGWEFTSPSDLSRMLREHVEKGDPRDVANFCMMLWHHSAQIAPQPQAAEPKGLTEERPSFTNPLTPYGMLVRALRIVAGTTLYDMAKALLTTPAKLSAMEFGRTSVAQEFTFDVSAYFDALGIPNTQQALKAALLAKGEMTC